MAKENDKLMKRIERCFSRWIPIAVIAAPVITWIIDVNSAEWFNGYVFSHERLILNAALTFIGMLLLLKPQSTKSAKK